MNFLFSLSRLVHRTNRNRSDPIGMQICFGERLIDPALVRAERPAILQQERNSFERGTLFASGLWLAGRA